jgi:hypothetical protein
MITDIKITVQTPKTTQLITSFLSPTFTNKIAAVINCNKFTILIYNKNCSEKL